ncbi:peptidoglycan-binding domain-containing protein [Streptomyces mirabilis]|uniref:peptidoglycan-binding domain-containing protein n=1 Tax=Streptomyces mirabilis TaxID=68239 RepID=UPI00339DA88A
MSIKSKIAKGAVAVTVAATALAGAAGTASASTTAPTIGNGYANNGNAVWCVQESLNYFGKEPNLPVPVPTVSQDGIWGPKTEQVVKAFQQDITGLKADGYVGPITGENLLGYGDPYYTGYGIAKNNAYCYQYIPSTT